MANKQKRPPEELAKADGYPSYETIRLPFTTIDHPDENLPGYSPELAARFRELAQIIVQPYGTVQSYEADEVAAALCELITYFVYQRDMSERESMQWSVMTPAFDRTEAQDRAMDAFSKRRLVLSEGSASDE